MNRSMSNSRAEVKAVAGGAPCVAAGQAYVARHRIPARRGQLAVRYNDQIPGTPDGIAAIEQAIFEGVPIYVTLLLSREHYMDAAQAYLRAIERRLFAGLDPRIASVASLFVSSWDVTAKDDISPPLRNCPGRAVAMLTCKAYLDLLATGSWNKLAAGGRRRCHCWREGNGLQYGWAPIGQTRCAFSGGHEQRVNVLGALRHDSTLFWLIQEERTVRNDVIAFFDQIAEQSHSVPRIIVLDNAGIHHGEVMEQKRQEWEQHGLYLYYLPPYSPELNRIEILWKQAKYFWRKFTHLSPGALGDLPVFGNAQTRSAPTHSADIRIFMAYFNLIFAINGSNARRVKIGGARLRQPIKE